MNKLSISMNGLTYVISYILNIFSSLIVITIIFIGLCYVNLSISLLSIFVFTITYYILLSKSRLFLSRNSSLILKYGQSQLKLIQEILGSFRDVIINSNQSFFIKNYKEVDIPMRYKLSENRFISASPRFILENIGFVFLAILTVIWRSENTKYHSVIRNNSTCCEKILLVCSLYFKE